MANFNHDGVRFHYEDVGEGQPIVFLHGVWMSGQFFHKQIASLSGAMRVLTLDFRGHGRSTDTHEGHTLTTYARDVHALLQALNLQNVILVGWSMGALVGWEYLQQFGETRVQGVVVVDEGAAEFAWPDYPHGGTTFEQLQQVMHLVQVDRETLLPLFIREMFKALPSAEDLAWMQREMTQITPASASAIFFDLIMRDYRATLAGVTVPALLCFGRDEKMASVAAGEHLQGLLSQSNLVLFEQSGHCPFLEEPKVFNSEVAQFVNSLN